MTMGVGQAESVGLSAAANTHLTGRWLGAARWAWFALLVAIVAPFVAALPTYLRDEAQPPSTNATFSPQAAQALISAGVSLQAYAWVSFALLCIVTLIALALALLLAWRRSDDWMAMAVSLFIVAYTVSSMGINRYLANANPATVLDFLGAILANVPSFVILVGALLIFPNGRFAPRWTWMLLLLIALWALLFAVFPALWNGALYLGYPVIVLSLSACMVYRYRRVSSPTERLQTKWIVVGLVLTLVANQVFWIPTGFTPLGSTIYPPIAYLCYQALLTLPPISFFIAIQRHNLYGIDTIINRALVYGALTAILAGVYVVCVFGAQRLVGSVAGAGPVSIVITTLLIAALFQPLRSRLQAAVDHRFYRSKYDAARTVSAFSETLRQQVELDELQRRLLDVVENTMQPEHASLTLMATGARRDHAAAATGHGKL